jgi:hypothetical protein
MQLENYHSNDNSNDVFLSMQNNALNETMILYHNYTQLQHLVTVTNLNTLDIRMREHYKLKKQQQLEANSST